MNQKYMVRPAIAVLLFGALIAACGDDNSENQNDQPPTAVIDAPVAMATFAAGDLIAFSGHASDNEDGVIPGTSLTWWADLHHDTHSHPFMPEQSGASGDVMLPTTGETSDNIWYRFYLRAVDQAGHADTTYVEIFPRKAELTVTAVGAGLQVTLDGQPHPAPYTVTSVVGMQREIGAASPQVTVDSTYTFASWSDGGAQTHVITMPEADTTFTAAFTATGGGNTPPTVSLTAPADGASLPVNVATTLTATSGDADGTVLAVSFRDGATVIGTDSSSPYSAEWTPAATGGHTLTAAATDDDGTVTISTPVAVTVTGGSGSDTEAPTITWTSPSEGASDLTGAVNLTANATDNVGVAGVEFQLDGESLGEDLTAPYAASLPSTATYSTGIHLFRARSRDAAGNTSAWALRHVAFGGAVDLRAGFVRTTFTSGLGGRATAMTFAPDGRLFICQQNGALRVVSNGTLLTAPFITLTVDDDNERGLLGVAFDPDFANNHYVYLYYTVPGTIAHNRVSRFTANGDVVVPGSELPIVDLPSLSSAGNHNGGALHFGADGKLYIAVGENANGPNAQSDTTRLGKMLRVNTNGSIPTDNPFYNSNTGLNRMIWAKGLRNPFTFAVQPGTGRIFINDVGQNTWEEINEGVAGANYGWPNTEGVTTNPAYVSPLFTYKHSLGADNPSLLVGFVITGGAFYNPATVTFPANYVGDYFFADYEGKWIVRLDLDNDNGAYQFARINRNVTDLAVGADGALYALADINGTWGVFRYAPQ